MDFTNVSQNYEAGTKVLASQFVFGLSRKTQWLSGLYYADFISFYSPTQLCGGGTKSSLQLLFTRLFHVPEVGYSTT